MRVKLPCGSYTEIDKEDEFLKKEFPMWRSVKGYVRIARDIKTPYGRVRQEIYLHRAIVKPPRAFDIDHIDRNPMNNKRSNLRLASRGENAVNQAKSKGTVSKYRGVSFRKNNKKNPWYAYTAKAGKQTSLGYFPTEKEAAIARDKFAKQTWGEFAQLNFPDSCE